MFSKLAFVASLAVLACCQSTSSASDPATAGLLGTLGVALEGVDVPIGVTCSPITVIGAGGGSNCASQPVCCENNSFNGVVALGCTPINLGL
ncbi:fungal hydrophobin [Pyrrhoderma noxium]|uniref:Hydrophobin n=1 Tax=Pyrrhoderma noxium TaxID=2282107 RepID=A0A286U5X3_9AGAM|nr:fungal hydrophobin [Pyrrhoderma noxium]